MKSRSLLLAGLCAVACVVNVNAQVVHVIFSNQGNHVGMSPVPGSTSTDFWNVVPSDGNNDIPTDFGAFSTTETDPSTVTYEEYTTVSGQFLMGFLPNPDGNPIFANYGHRGTSELMIFSLAGLEPGALYDIYVYAGRNLTDSSTFRIGSTTLTTTFSGVQSEFIEGTNYVRFSNIAASSDQGQITLWGESGIINGFSIVAVPEPSAVVLVVLGMSSGFLYRRRRQSTREIWG